MSKRNRKWFITKENGIKEVTDCHKAWLYEKNYKTNNYEGSFLLRWFISKIYREGMGEKKVIDLITIYYITIELLITAAMGSIYLLTYNAIMLIGKDNNYILALIFGIVIAVAPFILRDNAYLLMIYMILPLLNISDGNRYVALLIGSSLFATYIIVNTLYWRHRKLIMVDKIHQLNKERCRNCKHNYICISDEDRRQSGRAHTSILYYINKIVVWGKTHYLSLLGKR